MKVGIITILNVNNYGAELQAFALQKKMISWGHHAEIINYLYYKNPRHIRTARSKPFVRLSAVQKFKEKLFPVVANLKAIPYWNSKKSRDRKFSAFHHENTRMSMEYQSMDDLYRNKTWDYDVFVTGSDQVWNPNSGSNIEPYFLTFAPKKAKKIAYASSFGVDSIPSEYHGVYKDYLNEFDKLAVREESGVELIKKIASRDVNWVLDPTFLLNKTEWAKLAANPNIEGSYLLIYALTDSDYIKELAKNIATKRGMKIVRLCKNASKEDNDPSIINIIDAGPKEFLGLFLNASFVLTTSFHGVCFSLNFNIPFYSILKKEKTNNSRQLNLLAYLGLSNRVLFVNDDVPEEVETGINFNVVNEKLKEKIESSENYLSQSLADVGLSEVSK
ncbi:polysaccharide pyruvyl transferase family protein [Echinicola marina]|uniref:polysaccharide pyruvyl transferase family protein n=1 Tax=Echinicola marina TaxID=2859768 RepID=UPI001CF6BC73|nr:polysaccharide pyruvyl transferase family protein [Echinicola marina]UCS93980.1 polysaccharide pyruvyl transferase family protein [Echinicola marina]